MTAPHKSTRLFSHLRLFHTLRSHSPHLESRLLQSSWLRHYWLPLMCTVLAVFAIMETLMYIPLGIIRNTDIPFCAVYVVSLAATVLWTSVGPWLVACVWIAREYTPFISPQSMFLGFALSLALIGYRHPHLGALVAALAACSSSFIALTQGSYLPYVASSTVMYLVWYGSFVIFGALLHRVRQQERIQSQMFRDRLTLATARELHDSTANDIAFTVAQLNQLRTRYNHCTDQSFCNDLNTALRHAERALNHTRMLIETLQKTADNSAALVYASGMDDQWFTKLTTLIQQWDHDLNGLGFRGLSVVPDESATAMSAEHTHILLSLTHELYGNILKHAQPNGWYVVTVGLNPHHVTIAVTDISNECKAGNTQSKSNTQPKTHHHAANIHIYDQVNTPPGVYGDGHVDEQIREHIDTYDDGDSSSTRTGTGLRRLQHILRHHGGTITLVDHKAEWTTTATLPYICDNELALLD